MKRIAALILSMALLALGTGCAKQEEGLSDDAREGTMDIGQPAPGDTGDTGAVQGAATIYGRVDSIVGNEVTLSLGEPQQGANAAPEGAQGAPGGDTSAQGTPGDTSAQADASGQSGARPSGASGERPSGASGERPSGGRGAAGSASGNASGEMPSGGMPSGGMPSGEMPSGEIPSGMPSDASQQGGRSVTLNYSGESAKYLLPVGMAIDGGDFSDVTQGMVLSLTLDAEDTIVAVSILSR